MQATEKVKVLCFIIVCLWVYGMSEFIQWSFKKIETMRNQSTYIGYTKNYGIKTNSISKYLQISRKKSLFSPTALRWELRQGLNNGNLHIFQQYCWRKWDGTLSCRLLTFFMYSCCGSASRHRSTALSESAVVNGSVAFSFNQWRKILDLQWDLLAF